MTDDLTTRLTATAAFLQAHHYDAADVLEAIAVIKRLTAERDGAYERAALVADRWRRSDYDESANVMAQSICDDIRKLAE